MANSFLAAGSGSKYKVQGADRAGFWAGLWHGTIAPFAFLVSLWDDQVSIYETNNNGKWYEFGFMVGVGSYSSSFMIKR
jgi:hypothetical protein